MSIFTIRSFVDLSRKARLEIARLNEIETNPDYDFCIFNVIFTLNHMYDWAVKDDHLSADAKIRCINQFNPFDSDNGEEPPRDLKQHYPSDGRIPCNFKQRVIRQLCNKAKHVLDVPHELPAPRYTCGAGDPIMQCGEPAAVSGAFSHRTFSVECNGQHYDLATLLLDVATSWDEFTRDT